MFKGPRALIKAYGRWLTGGSKTRLFLGTAALVVAVAAIVLLGDDETREQLKRHFSCTEEQAKEDLIEDAEFASVA